MAAFYARLKNQCIFKNQVVFSARFDKQDEDDQLSDEIELLIKSNNNQNLTGEIILILISKLQ